MVSRPTPISKRIMDLVLSMLLLLLSWPLWLLIAILIKLDSEGPIIFKAQRVGKGGKVFILYKFRTMVKDAEQKLGELAHLNEGGPYMIRIPNDPRVTRVGRILRRLNLDELPQLINVLKGDISLIGPRPQAPNEVALYSSYQRRRLEVLPGATGLWQVTCREEADFDKWVHMDIEYIDNWSLWLDVKIALKTVWVIFTRPALLYFIELWGKILARATRSSVGVKE